MVYVAFEVPGGCINREIQVTMGRMGLRFDIDNEGIHTETTATGEVPKEKNLVLKGRPIPLQINIIVTEHQECENQWTTNTHMYKPES